MKKTLTLFATFSLSIIIYAQDYFVGFFGEKMNLTSVTGHAFIGIGKGVPLTCDINGDSTEMWGFYPKIKIEGAKSLWSGPVDSKIKNDVRTKTDLYFFKRIEFADYIRVKIKLDEWIKKRYELTKQDCISFFIDVAKLFSDIKIPDRKIYTLPEYFVKEFIAMNK